MDSKIILRCNATGWSAQFLGPAATEVIAAMGSDTIPTAYTAQMPAARVQALIAALNPGIRVELVHRGN